MGIVKYEVSFFETPLLRKWAYKYLALVPRNVTGIISGGSSGCSIGAAMITVTRRKTLAHWHIRKKSVSHHGCSHTGSHFGKPNKTKVVIVDDFIDSGATIGWLINECVKHKYIIKAIIVNRWFAYDEDSQPFFFKHNNQKIRILYAE